MYLKDKNVKNSDIPKMLTNLDNMSVLERFKVSCMRWVGGILIWFDITLQRSYKITFE